MHSAGLVFVRRCGLAALTRGGGAPSEIVERHGRRKVNDPGTPGPHRGPRARRHRRQGRRVPRRQDRSPRLFVGQVMRQSGGNANPAVVSLLVQERLGG